MTLGGDIITIDIDGVAFDQLECVTGKRLPAKWGNFVAPGGSASPKWGPKVK